MRVFRLQGPTVEHEPAQSELSRLRKEQAKTLRDEVFGGLSSTERVAYNRKQDRIRELERRLFGTSRGLGRLGSDPVY